MRTTRTSTRSDGFVCDRTHLNRFVWRGSHPDVLVMDIGCVGLPPLCNPLRCVATVVESQRLAWFGASFTWTCMVAFRFEPASQLSHALACCFVLRVFVYPGMSFMTFTNEEKTNAIRLGRGAGHLCTAAHSRPCAALSQHVRTACLHRVPRHRSALVVAQVCKHRLASVFLTPDCLAGAITSLSIGVVGNCLIGLLIGFALQPARVPSRSVSVIPTRENAPRPEPGVCGCGPCICREPSASQSQWSETASEGAAFLFNLVVGFAIGVCTCVTLCCTHRLVSLEIILSAQQLRSLPFVNLRELEHGNCEVA